MCRHFTCILDADSLPYMNCLFPVCSLSSLCGVLPVRCFPGYFCQTYLFLFMASMFMSCFKNSCIKKNKQKKPVLFLYICSVSEAFYYVVGRPKLVLCLYVQWILVLSEPLWYRPVLFYSEVSNQRNGIAVHWKLGVAAACILFSFWPLSSVFPMLHRFLMYPGLLRSCVCQERVVRLSLSILLCCGWAGLVPDLPPFVCVCLCYLPPDKSHSKLRGPDWARTIKLVLLLVSWVCSWLSGHRPPYPVPCGRYLNSGVAGHGSSLRTSYILVCGKDLGSVAQV